MSYKTGDVVMVGPAYVGDGRYAPDGWEGPATIVRAVGASDYLLSRGACSVMSDDGGDVYLSVSRLSPAPMSWSELGESYNRRAGLIDEPVFIDPLGSLVVGERYFFVDWQVDDLRAEFEEIPEEFRDVCDFITWVKVTSQEW